MMITIHGFPAQTKYPDVKLLIQQQCKIEDFMVGNMLPEKGGTKKVRIGLSDDNEGYTVIKCLDGFRMSGNCVLKTIPVVKSTPNQQQQPFERPAFSGNEYPRNDYPPGNDYPAQSSFGNRGPPHGTNGPPLSTGPTCPGGPSGRPSQWSNNNPASWNNNTPIAAQNPPNNFNYQQPNVQSFGQPHPGHTQRPEVRPFQGRPSQDQGYGFPPKSNVPDHGPVRPVETRQLRSIETVDVGGNAPHGRYPPSQPYHQDKPVTIMKENFQGPTQYNINNPDGQASHYQEPRPQPWQDHGQPGKSQQFSKPTPMGFEKPYEDRKYPPTNEREMQKPAQMRPDTYKGYENTSRGYSPGRSAIRGSPMERRVSPSGRLVSPPGRRLSPSGRRLSPPARRLSPSGRRISPPGRRLSPSGRRLSPSGGRLSPSGRRVSPPGRRLSPPGRRLSPPGRRLSPSGRRLSPSGRRFSPPGRRVSPPGRMLSPSGRKLSPPVRRFSPSRNAPMGVGRVPEPVESSVLKRASPQRDRRRDSPPRSAMRYSPGRHLPEKILDKYGQDATAVKRVRPAYEPPTQASNQAMYSGGYRQSPHETVQYPVGGPRQGDSRSPWQRDRDDYPRKPDEDRRGPPRMEIPRNAEKIIEPTRPPIRKSRSPVRRDRSPIRDRFKRHSPSPRSPRRSWALEKRRSPDISEAPPPPAWPGQGRDDNLAPIDNRHGRNFPGREQPVPTSSRAGFSKAESPIPKWEDNRHPEYEERKPYKPARDVEREIHASHDRYQPRDPKFSPREDFDLEPRNEYRRKDEPPSKYREDERRPRDEDRRHMEDRRARDDSPLRREIAEKLLKVQSIDKDFEDIYNRALQFKKKAEELRRSANRRGESEEVHSGRPRDEKRFDDRRDRYRDEEHRKDTEVRPGDDDYYKRDNKERNRGAIVKPKRFNISSAVRAKREKAVEEIAKKIMERHPDFNRLEGEQRQRVVIELQLAIARIVFDMFEDKDVSFIEIVVKYQAKYTVKDEEAILQEVVASLPRQFRNIKRHATESKSEIPSKTARRSSSPGLKQELPAGSKFSDQKISDWTIIDPPKVIIPMTLGMQHMAPMVNPMMVPSPFISTFTEVHNDPYPPKQEPIPQESSEFSYSLYLCKDDFEPFFERQAELLKDFLVSQIFAVTAASQGWSPDITIKGLQGMLRYEIQCNDNLSRDWLISLDFSEFRYYNILVYTKEELWYERAAIWLPGHSRFRKIEPLDKLKLQNKKLEGVNIGKWKFVKKIVTAKGTRLYVDIPPSSARALDKHKMMLSYELQKVNVFLKAVAVDKDAFDVGMKDTPLNDPAEIAEAIRNTPIPALACDSSVVKVTLKGSKTLNLEQARKIKEVIIYHLFKYLQEDGNSKTDFAKYGFVAPSYFGVVPENSESKRWMTARHFGKVNRQQIVVLGDDDDNTRFFRMVVDLPGLFNSNMSVVSERLRQSNQGVKGLNFNLWKQIKLVSDNMNPKYEVDIDLESLETLSKLHYRLDFVDQTNVIDTVRFRSPYYSKAALEDKIKKYRAEMTDIYDDATMDLESNDSNDEVICLN